MRDPRGRQGKERDMNYVLIRHKVADFTQWKAVFDAHRGTRQDAGLKEKYVLRGVQNLNEVVILLEAEDLQKARAFMDSADLREVMDKAGVLGKPDVYFLQ
jgi:hypothetical protein